MKRTNLKIFRIRHDLTQSEMAERIGYERAGYSLVEMGARNPSIDFFTNLQNAFDIPDADMWELTKVDEKKS